MVGGEDGETRGHTAHWERRKVGAEKVGAWGLRCKVGKGTRRRKADREKEEEGGGKSERIREKERARQKARSR